MKYPSSALAALAAWIALQPCAQARHAEEWPTSCVFGRQLAVGSPVERKLIKIAHDAIEKEVWKGATPHRPIACDRGDIWAVEYVAKPHSIPHISHVTIDKKTMEVIQIFFNQ